MKKKILFLITQSEFGGAQRFLSTLVPQLDLQKYNILVATGSTGDRHFTEHLNNLKIPNTTLKHLVRNPNLWHDVRAVGEIRKLIEDFRPTTLFLLSSKAGFLGSLAARKDKIKIIYRIGGWAFNDPQSPLRRRVIIWAERWSARWKDIIIVNNRHDLEQAEKLNIKPKQQLLLIHNGLDVDKIKFLPKEKAREKLGIAQNDFIIGTIANFYPSKGLPYFVEAAHMLPYTFVIIGDGEDPPPSAKNVLMLGRVPEATKYLSAFDIFVSPSVKEGFQWAVLEAMAARVPVIATRVGAAPEIIEDGKNGFLVPPCNSQAIADRITTLANDETRRRLFGAHSYQTVMETFGRDRMVKNMLRLLGDTSVHEV